MFYWFIKYVAWPFRRFYFRVEVSGLEHIPRRGAAILVANHASYLDAGILGAVVPRKVHFVVLSRMYKLWRIRWFYAGMETIAVNPGAGAHAPIRRALAVLRAGSVLGIFPEGSRSPDGGLRPAQEGTALLAMKSAAAVIPAGIEGAYEAFPRGAWFPRPRKIRVRFGPALRFPAGRGRGRSATRRALMAFSADTMRAIAALLPDAPRDRAVAAAEEAR